MQDISFSRKLYKRYFVDKYGGTLLECGAYDGNNHSVGKFFEDNYGWRCINIEPNPRLYSYLVLNRPNSFLNMNVALSDKEDKIELIVPKNAKGIEMRGHGSIAYDYMDSHPKNKFSEERSNRYVVSTNTYSNIIKDLGLELIDLFVLDVEGHELEVIKGMEGCQIMPRVLSAEINKVDKNDILVALNRITPYDLDFNDDHDAFYIRKD